MQNPTASDVMRESSPAIEYIKKHLSCFKCYTQPADASDGLAQYAAITTAIAKFQKSMGLSSTGVFDPQTAERLRQPHCHNHNGPGNNIFPEEWYKDTRKLSYCFEQYPDHGLSVVEVRAAFEVAFEGWGAHFVPPLSFVEMSPHKQVDIRIAWREDFERLVVEDEGHNIDNRNTSTMQTLYPPSCADTEDTDTEAMNSENEQHEIVKWKDDFCAVSYSPLSKEGTCADIKIYFDDKPADEKGGDQPISNRLVCMVIHQIGHILGLGHSDNENAVMWPVHHNAMLHSDDTTTIKAKYRSQVRDVSTKEYGQWNQIEYRGLKLEPIKFNIAAIVAAPGGKLYRQDDNGSVWEYEESGREWERVNDGLPAVQIDATSQYLFLVQKDGHIYRRGSSKTWEQIESPSPHAPARVIRAARDGKALYQLYGTDSLYVSCFSNEPGCRWRLLDRCTKGGTTDIVATGSEVFIIHENGTIYQSNGKYRRSHPIQRETNLKPLRIVGSENLLYKSDATTGSLYQWEVNLDWIDTHLPLHPPRIRPVNLNRIEVRLPTKPCEVMIAAAGSYVYAFPPEQNALLGCAGFYNNRKDVWGSPGSWVEMPCLPAAKVKQLTAADSSLYCLSGSGHIYIHRFQPRG